MITPTRPVSQGAAPASVAPTGISPLARPELRPALVCLLLLVSSVAWRKGAYYTGGLDPVVLGKAVLGLVALALSATAPRHGTPWHRLGAGPVPWLVLYLCVTTTGALLAGTGLPTVILAARVVLIIGTVVLLVRAYPPEVLLSALTSSMLLLAGVAALSGIGSLADGRLYGGIPPLNANEISLLISVPLLCLVWRWAHRVATPRDLVAILPLLGVIWLTGTRTGLVALLLAVLVIVLMVPRVPAPVFCAAVLTVPAGLAAVSLTSVVSAYATRGDSTSVLTLNSRTVAWDAALHYADTLPAQLVGVGLAVKKIPVSAMYRTEQILDSTWVSALVQAGAIGTAVLAVMLVLTFGRALAAPAPFRALVVAVIVLLLGRSFLESGLFDASPSFIVFLCFTLLVPCGRVREKGP